MIIIGDVHGCYKTLIELIKQLPENEQICFVGDIIDRGKDSYKVVEYIIKNNHLCVLGNHEQMMIDSQGENNYMTQNWIKQGGLETLNSYPKIFNLQEKKLEIDNLKINEHLNYFKTLPLYIEQKFDGYKNLIISHSFIIDKIDEYKLKIIDFNEKEDILWNRKVLLKKFVDMDEKNYFNVFGHTIMKEELLTENFAAIDTGAFLNKFDYIKEGDLTAIQYPSLKIFKQKSLEN